MKRIIADKGDIVMINDKGIVVSGEVIIKAPKIVIVNK